MAQLMLQNEGNPSRNFPEVSPEIRNIHKDDPAPASVPETSITCEGRRKMSRREVFSAIAAAPLAGIPAAALCAPVSKSEAVAPITPGLLVAYQTWLHNEYREVCWELANRDSKVMPYVKSLIYSDQPADEFHQFDGSYKERAASVLSTVGCEWRHAEMEHWASEAFPYLTGQTAARVAGKPDDDQDPVFAAIKKHLTHEAKFSRFCGITENMKERPQALPRTRLKKSSKRLRMMTRQQGSSL